MVEPDPPRDDDSDSSSPPSSGGSDESGNFSSWHAMAGIGVEFIVAVGLFAVIGWWLDGKLNTTPWLLISGCGLGFAIGLMQMVRSAQKMMK